MVTLDWSAPPVMVYLACSEQLTVGPVVLPEFTMPLVLDVIVGIVLSKENTLEKSAWVTDAVLGLATLVELMVSEASRT